MAALPLQLVVVMSWVAAQVAAPVERPPESIAVIAVADPPLGPAADLADLAHQLRTACRERVGGVEDAQSMRVRFGASGTEAALAELERAYVGAQAAFQADEIDSAIRTFRGIASDLERLPESNEAFSQWLRVELRLALAERTMNRPSEMAAAVERIVAVVPGFVVDPEQFAPSFRRDFDEVRRRVAAAPKRTLILRSSPRPVTAYVNGKEVGTTPTTVSVPPGKYRVGGADGDLRAPSVEVIVADEDREIDLDIGLADALRLGAGPGLALAGADRASGIVRAGQWLGAVRVFALATAGSGDERFLTGAAYDVARATVLREGQVRLGSGATSASIGALASFLLTGHASPEVLIPGLAPPIARTGRPGATESPGPMLTATAPGPPPPSQAAHHPWLRPGAYVAAAVAISTGAFAVQQALAARGAYGDASALVRPDGALVPGADRARYASAVARGEAANRNAYLAGAGAAMFAATAGVLGYLSWDARGAPVIRF